MAINKTRNILIDVARQLFARLGVENTTMNDIAVASHKGRRTLYTYFNNKNEVYQAVLETELDQMFHALQTVANKNLPADEKLLLFFYTRFDAVKNVVARNGTLKCPTLKLQRKYFTMRSKDWKYLTSEGKLEQRACKPNRKEKILLTLYLRE